MNKTNHTYCCVPQCNTRGNDPNVSFHRFPTEKYAYERGRKQVWILKLRIGKEISKWMVVCSKHFKRSDYFFPDKPSNRPRLKRTAIPSLCLPQTVIEDTKTVVKKNNLNKKTFHSVARKKIGKVQIDSAFVSSTNSTFERKTKQETSTETLLELGNNKERNLVDEDPTSDKSEVDAKNASFHQSCNSDAIFGQYIASEMRTLKDDPLLYLQVKQSILELLTSANFELINLQ